MTIDDYIKEQCQLMPCDYHKVQFRNATSEICDKLAGEYMEQQKQGLITWAELGRQLERLENERIKLLQAINRI